MEEEKQLIPTAIDEAEIVINGLTPAIANAIYDAVGVRLYRIPFTPGRVLRLLREKHRR